jgi:hypothetical protein
LHLRRSRFAARYCEAGVGSMGFLVLGALEISDFRLQIAELNIPHLQGLVNGRFPICNLESAICFSFVPQSLHGIEL